MPGENVGEAFVLIRPDTTGFQSAAESQVSAAGKALGKVFATAFAVGGVAEGVKSVVDAAAQHQAAFAVLARTVKDAGASNTLYGKSLEDLLDKQARLSGFSDEDLASAFQRLVSVTHNSAAAYTDLGKAEDLARFRHIDVAQAALALAKAEQGSATSLQRYGIAAVKVTTQADALKAEHEKLIESGAKLDTQQKAAYTSALQVAEAHDKQASATATLAEVEQRTGGTAAAFANTDLGKLQRFQVDVHQLKVALGDELLPALTSGVDALDKWLENTNHVAELQHAFGQGVQTVVAAFHDLQGVVETVGPPLATVVDHLGGFERVGEGIASVWAAGKINSALTGANTAIQTLGGTASVAEGQVAGLSGALAALGRLGVISIAVELVLHKQQVDSFLKSHGLGFLTESGTSLAKHVLAGGATASPEAVEKFGGGFSLDPGDTRPDTTGAVPRVHFNFAGGPDLPSVIAARARAAASSGAATASLKQSAQQVAQSYAGALLTETTTGQAHATLTTAAKATIQTLADTVSTDQADLAQLKTNLADTVRQGAEAVNQAVQQAKQNLNTIGQDLATSVANVLNQPLTVAQQQLGDAQDKVTADYDRRAAALQGRSNQLQRESNALSLIGARQNLKQLSEGIVLPGGRPLSSNPAEATRQLEQLAKRSPADAALQQYILQYRQANLGVGQAQLAVRQTSLDQQHGAATTVLQLRGDALKLAQDLTARQQTAATRRINDLTDEANKGAISPTQLRNRITNVLTTYGITRSAAQRELGIAAADTLTGQLQGLGLQAAANAAGPQRAGTGLIPSLVKPLDTLRQTVKASADAQLSESKAQTKVLKDQAKYLKTLAGDKAAAKFTGSLARNPGQQTKTSKALVGVSG
jgi:hypothetical protein